MKGQLRKRDPRWRCVNPKKHPADCHCRLTVNIPYQKTRRVIPPA